MVVSIEKLVWHVSANRIPSSRNTQFHTTEQNGMAERMNRTLVETTRCILKTAGLIIRTCGVHDDSCGFSERSVEFI